jgi:hypothetical protein
MGKSRKVSSISKEFDGKEVQGKRIERSGLFGSNVSKEVFKMPGGGKHIEKTRTNKKGDVVSKSTKDTKVNPLVFFNKNKTEAYKKAGGEMAKFRKSLPQKGDGGRWHAPMVLPENPKTQSPVEGPINSPTNAMRANQSINQVSPEDALRKAQESNAINAKKASFQDLKKRYDNTAPVPGKNPGVRQGLTLEQMSLLNSKKGGSVKRKKK